MSLNEELYIKVMEQKRLGSANFLGQVQIPIKALQMDSEPEWYFLTDAPSDAAGKPNSMLSWYYTLIDNDPIIERASIVITGEIKVKLVFVHRLKKAQSTMLPATKQSEASPPTPMTAASSNESSPATTPSSLSPTSGHHSEPPSPLEGMF